MILGREVGLDFAFYTYATKSDAMNSSRLLGAVALVVGINLLLSELWLEQDIMMERTGVLMMSLSVLAGIVSLLGMVALRLGIDDDREAPH